MRNICFGAIADDLTGGVELASMLVAAGVRTQFFVGPLRDDPAVNADAVVVALKSRVAPTEAASQMCLEAGRFLASHRPRQMFFKYCATFASTPKGNIGPCVDPLMELSGATQTIFCPAFPEFDRTVYNGHAFSGDVLLSASPKRFDPATPMTESNLAEVLRPQTGRKVGVLRWSKLAEGADACRAFIQQKRAEGIEYFIVDALCEDDLARIAAFSNDWPLVTGHSAMIRHYPPHWRAMNWIDAAAAPQPLPSVSGPGAIVAGSCSRRNLEQLHSFEQSGRPVLRIDLNDAANGVDVVETALAWATDRIGDNSFAIATSASPQSVGELQARLGREEASRLADDALARIAAGLVARGIRRLIVSGGETSGAVVDALKIRELQLGPYAKGKIPLSVAEGPTRLGLCLKSGALGSDEVFNEHLDAMAGR
ncbi:3-oxo-tetronate kinase [Devosia sp. A449]